MNKIVPFPGISHAFPGISHAQIPGDSQVMLLCHAVPGGRKPGLQDLQGIRELRFFTMLWMKKLDLYGILILYI